MGYYLLLCLFGAGVGVLSGLLGIGGGVALVPGLIILFGFSQEQAQGTSLAVLIPPIGIFAALAYYQRGQVQMPVVGWVALGFVVGAYFGALLVPAIPRTALSTVFGMLLLYVGFTFVFAPTSERSAAALPAGLAALVTALLAWLLRRKRATRPAAPRPPGEDIEYHL